MDVALRYWNEENKKVEMRYWNPKVLDCAAAHVADLLSISSRSTVDLVKDIGKSNIPVSRDAPNVNMKFYSELKKTWEDAKLSDLIDIGSVASRRFWGISFSWT